ncbi:MAG: hypothetical protein ACOYOP_01690 [Microthrixaceae bacterium]
MKRLLAGLVAVGLVVGAVVVRGALDGNGGSGGGGGPDGTFRLRCGTDLAAVCERLAKDDSDLAVTVEDEGVTADRLAAPDARVDFDAWLAAGPWADLVADDRRIAGATGPLLGRPGPVLASARAALLAQADRAAVLQTHCGAAGVTWACVGDAAGRPWSEIGGPATWGAVKPGLAAPATGTGLVTLAQAVASKLGTTDWAANDLDDPAVAGWFDQLVGAARQANPDGTDPARRFLVIPASFGAVGTLEGRSTTAAGRRGAESIYPEPVSTAEVRLVPAAGRSAAAAADRVGTDQLRSALRAEGWPTGAAAGTRDPGLPSAGALQALRTRWDEVA